MESRKLAQKKGPGEGTHRLLLHGRVNPNQSGDFETMDELKERWGVSAWKTYTQYGPGGRGYFLTDDVGLRFDFMTYGPRTRREFLNLLGRAVAT